MSKSTVNADRFSVSQFNADPLANRITVVLSDQNGGSLSLYSASSQGEGKDAIKQAALAALDDAKATIARL